MRQWVPGGLGLRAAILILGSLAPARAEEPPPLPPGGGLVIFDDHWAFGAKYETFLGETSQISIDRGVSRFGTGSLRVECADRSRVELIVHVDELIRKAPRAVEEGFLTASEEGALQFWLRAEAPSGGLESWFKIFSPPKEGEERKELWNSKFIGTSSYVVPGSEWQEVLIPLKDYGSWNMDWFHMVRSLYFRFPTRLHGTVYHIDQMRILFRYPKEKIPAQAAERDRRRAVQAKENPYLWVFRDGVQELVEQSHLTRQPGEDWPASPPSGTPLEEYFARLRMNISDPERDTRELFYDPEKWSFMIFDENQPYEGKRSLRVHSDLKHGIVFTVPFLELDLGAIRDRGCLHFMVKGKNGDERFRISLRSRREYGHAFSSAGDIRAWTERVSPTWTHIAIPLLDFPDRTGGGPFIWEKVNGLMIEAAGVDASEHVFWLDSIWFGRCGKEALP